MPYKAIVLSSGGVRGVAYAGALAEADRRGLLDAVTVFAGTSIGAAVAALLAIGYSGRELEQLVLSTDITGFVAEISLKKIINALYAWGLSDGSEIGRFLGQCLVEKGLNADCTLGELHRQRGHELRVCATNLKRNIPVIFSRRTHPDLPIVEACLCSMALPPLYQPRTLDGELYVDGALLNSFPCDDLDTTRGIVRRWRIALELTSIDKYFSRLAYVALQFAEFNNGIGRLERRPDIVEVDAGDVSTTNFALSQAVIAQLIESGHRAMALTAAQSPGGGPPSGQGAPQSG